MRSLIVSDLHIGDNSRTCWYQKDYHEPYLSALLDWIIGRQQDRDPPIDRLILLGDLFDFWTYTPARRPPSIDEIVSANPNIFGKSGKLRQVMDALGGNVIYLRGNHDINITQDDLNRIPTGKHKITLVDDLFCDEGVVYTHGHLFTMFNAPDPRFPGKVPVGHFVTRAVAHYVDHLLAAGQTAADLHNQGSPYGFSLKSLLPGLSSQLDNPSVTSMLLDYIAKRTGLAEDTPIRMADGSTTSIRQAKAIYDGLWTAWAEQNGGGAIGQLIAYKAALADYDGSYIAWFAQRAVVQHGAYGAVLGHTHIPKIGVLSSFFDYINSGFECPSRPDVEAGETRFTFTIHTGGRDGGLSLWQVTRSGGSYQIRPAPTSEAPPDQIVYDPSKDFSCYVEIQNTPGPYDLIRSGYGVTQSTHPAGHDCGYYVVPPPATIKAGQTGLLWIQDYLGRHGAEGWVEYSYIDAARQQKTVRFAFGCPTGVVDNYVRNASPGSPFTFYTRIGAPDTRWGAVNSVVKRGHPLIVAFVWGQGGPDQARSRPTTNG